MAGQTQQQQKPGFLRSIMMLVIVLGGLFFMLFSADASIDKISKFVVWVFVYAVVHALFTVSVATSALGQTLRAGDRLSVTGRGMAWFFRFFASYWAILVVLIGISAFVRPLWWVMMNPLVLWASVLLMPYLMNRAENAMDAGETLRTANATNTAGKAAQTAPIAGLIDTSATERPEPIEAIDTSKTERPVSLADRIYQQPVEPQRINLDPGTLRPDLPNPDWDDKK